MNKTFVPSEWEEKLYAFWEEKGFFNPKGDKPFTILMPPPNANASLHAGHGMYTVDDVMIRWKRLQGFASVWIPGLDHAGFETQYVYEKHLSKQGKSRMDFDRETLYKDIFQFVKENSGLIHTQFKRLGFLADWDRSVFTLDDHVLQRVFETFKQMEQENLIYRSEYIVNYCPHCGTSLAELEVVHVERQDPLYFVTYPLIDAEGYVTVATVRPEPIFVDTHLAVNPKDKKNNHLIGKKVKNPLTDSEMEIIGDEYVDPEFGTGIVKLTPAHDPNDFLVAKKHKLPIIQAINLYGKITEAGGKYAGLKVKAAREEVVKDLQEKGYIEKIDTEYMHSVSTCYKCGRDLEPLTIPNWFIKVESLKKDVVKAVQEDRVKFFPQKYKDHMLAWLDIMHDWPISRQIVWGIRIPVWYEVEPGATNISLSWIDKEGQRHHGSVSEFTDKGISLQEISEGLQKVYVQSNDASPKYVVAQDKPGENYLPETDTFDTWFSSGQWPLVTLKEDEFVSHFPTDFMGTASEILKFWISRMIMFSLYIKKEVPFKNVYLWSMVTDAKGQKMSKSKGNVVNPIDLVDKYGADAFRATLFFGVAPGGKVNLAEGKIIAMRNFANKIWNIGRFLKSYEKGPSTSDTTSNATLDSLTSEFDALKKSIHEKMEKFYFSIAFNDIYEFLWHRYADIYIEKLKDDARSGNIRVLEELERIYLECLILLHPFMPFVTEAAWKEFKGEDTSILDQSSE